VQIISFGPNDFFFSHHNPELIGVIGDLIDDTIQTNYDGWVSGTFTIVFPQHIRVNGRDTFGLREFSFVRITNESSNT
jgi:hypothetical protein